MSDRVTPATRLPAGAAERVLRRALDRADADGDLTVQDLMDVADDLDIPAPEVARALVEEVLSGGRAARPERWTDRLAGPAWAEASRVWDGPSAAPLVETWMTRGHCMRARRRLDGTVVWEPASGLAGRVRRMALSASGDGELVDMPSVTTRCAGYGGVSGVRLAADVGDPTSTTVAAAAVTGAGVTAAAVLAVAVTPALVLVAPAAAVIGAALLRHRRDRVVAVTGRLDRLAEAIARREEPRGVLGSVADTLRGR